MFYCTLVEENDLSPPREGPRSVETNLQELSSTFGENHGSLMGRQQIPCCVEELMIT